MRPASLDSDRAFGQRDESSHQKRTLARDAPTPDFREQRLPLSLGPCRVQPHAVELTPERVKLSIANREAAIAQRRPGVENFRGEVQHGAMLGRTPLDELPDYTLPHAGRSVRERGVQVDHCTLAAHARAGDEHVAGQHRQVGLVQCRQAHRLVVVGVSVAGHPTPAALAAEPLGRQPHHWHSHVFYYFEKLIAALRLALLPVAENVLNRGIQLTGGDGAVHRA